MTGTRHLTRLSRIALLAAGGDLLTKAAAKSFLAADPTYFSDWLQFAVVHNEDGAFGWTAGVYTWQLNLAITLAAIVFMIPVTRDLARVDRSAPTALGLIVGGALGNLASLLSSSDGVVDFIVVHYSGNGALALNVADVAAYAGLAMIVRTGFLIAAAIRHDVRIFDVRRKESVLSLFAEKSAAKRGLRGAVSVQAPRLLRGEVSVVDRGDLTRGGAMVADTLAPEPNDILDIRGAKAPRAPWIVRPQSHPVETDNRADSTDRPV